jgi:hypothetical protein
MPRQGRGGVQNACAADAGLLILYLQFKSQIMHPLNFCKADGSLQKTICLPTLTQINA